MVRQSKKVGEWMHATRFMGMRRSSGKEMAVGWYVTILVVAFLWMILSGGNSGPESPVGQATFTSAEADEWQDAYDRSINCVPQNC